MDQKSLRRGEMGITGAIIIVCQVISSFQSSRNLSSEIDQLKSEFHLSKTENEQYFVKKEELKIVSSKLDSMSSRLHNIQKQIKYLREFANIEPNVVGCSYDKKKWSLNAQSL